MEGKKAGSFLKLLKKKDVPKQEEDLLSNIPAELREMVEKEIKYCLSTSHTPEQIYTRLIEGGHPADKFVNFINECYLTDFIQDSFTRGFSMEQIREELENWNWPKEKVEWGINTFLKKK